jgi:iron(III) transport system substrate-binding protein
MKAFNRLVGTAVIAIACAAPALAATPVPDYPADYADTVAAAGREGRVVVYSVLSTKAAQPLIKDFQALYPGIAVDYDGDMGSNELVERFTGEVAASRPSADVVWSSAMDLQMKLVEDGHALSYRSPEASHLPAWAAYRDRAWGTTFEPVVFVYNKDRVSGADVPRDHAAFARLLHDKAAELRGRVATFDIEKSGVGYMFAAQDSRHFGGVAALLQGLGESGVRASPGTGDMLTRVASGEYLLGYNIMGSYAMTRSRGDLPSLGVVLPQDYMLVLSRVMFISRDAPHPNAAKLWADYLLSRRGQKIIGDALQLYAIRDDAGAELTAAQLSKHIGNAVRPIPIDASLTTTLEPARQRAFIAAWNASIAKGAAK